MLKEEFRKNSFFYKNWKKIHSGIYYVSLIIFAISLSTSEFGMSVSMFALFGNWLLDIFLSNHLYNVPLSAKLKLFWKDKAALIIFSLLILHAIGIFYSEDLKHAIKDIRIKLPIGVFTLVIASEFKLSAKQIRTIILFFVLTVFTSSLICYIYYKTHEILNIRDISLFISHIRFGLMISLSIYLAIYLIRKSKYNSFKKVLIFLLIPWFIFYLMLSENITGFTITIIVGIILLFHILIKSKNKIIKFTSIAIIVVIPTLSYYYLKNIYKDVYHVNQIDLTKLDKSTENGNIYIHNKKGVQTENGNLVGLYFCEKELKQEWPKYSSIKYYEKDKLEQSIRFTLFRYLTSKGLRKDSAGLSKLNKNDIQAVENGIPNYKFLENSNLRNRIHQILWEIKNYSYTQNASGHSVALRIEFWKTGLGIIKDYPLFGVGTGDIYLAYDKKYKELNTNITEKWRFLSHNQFIYTAVILGIFGLLWFLFSLIFPIIIKHKFKYYPFIIFFIILFLSFFTEDTLTTQPGVCFYAFFNALFLFNPKKD